MEEKTIFWIKVVSVSVLILSWVVLIYIHYETERSLRIPLIITIIISIMSVISLFGNNLYKKFKDIEEKIPEQISDDEMRELMEKEANKMWNHLAKGNEIERKKVRIVNKNVMLACKVNLLYDEKFGNSCWIVLNTNYPKIFPTIMKEDSSDYLIEKAMNYMSLNPLDEPDEEERKELDLSTGKQITYKKKTHKKKEEKKEGIM